MLPGTTLTSVLRHSLGLPPTASVSHALDILRCGGMDTVPIVDDNSRILGVLTMTDLRSLLQTADSQAALAAPVSSVMRKPGGVAKADMSLEDVRLELLRSGETAVAVLDERDAYLGMVGLADLIAPLPVRPRPAMIGGMATPWGVYLTNGSIQAGTGNSALVGSGIMMGALIVFSHSIVGVGAWIVQSFTSFRLFYLFKAAVPMNVTADTVGWILLHGLSLPIFFLILRALPLSKYHAAEHQAVHAMELGEPLCPEIVRRMPRVHPRCGTNIMAGGLVFILVSQGLGALRLDWLDVWDATILGAVTTLFTWRSVGAFLQQYFTTRPAGSNHLASGIAAAESLEMKFLHSPPGRPTLRRRIWCSGMLQTVAGVWFAVFLCSRLSDWLLQTLP